MDKNNHDVTLHLKLDCAAMQDRSFFEKYSTFDKYMRCYSFVVKVLLTVFKLHKNKLFRRCYSRI